MVHYQFRSYFVATVLTAVLVGLLVHAHHHSLAAAVMTAGILLLVGCFMLGIEDERRDQKNRSRRHFEVLWAEAWPPVETVIRQIDNLLNRRAQETRELDDAVQRIERLQTVSDFLGHYPPDSLYLCKLHAFASLCSSLLFHMYAMRIALQRGALPYNEEKDDLKLIMGNLHQAAEDLRGEMKRVNDD
jgi:hypothetical protein